MPTYQSYALPAVSAGGGVPQTGGTLVQCNNLPQNLPATLGGKFVGCASAAPQNDNWLDELIGPNYIDYPLWRADDYSPTPTPQPSPPTTTGGTPTGGPSPTGGASSSPAAPSQPVAMLQMPGMAQPVPVMIMATVATVPQSAPSSSGGSSAPSNPSTPANSSTPANPPQPTAELATMPVLAPPVVRTFSTNPAIPTVMQPLNKQQHKRRTQADELAALFGVRVRHVKHPAKGGHPTDAVEVDATPIQLRVPPNCNAMEVTLGAIEPLADGAEGDMSNLLDAGKQAITDVNGTELDETNLSPGDTVFLHIPWRAPANAKVAAGVARRAVKVEFYKNVEYWQPQGS
jgi:hypothetical protein